MKEGKKSVAERIVYDSLDLVEKRGNDEALKTFKRALENVRPRVEVKSRRVGGATYQVPVEIRGDRGTALAMRWIIQSARARSGKSMQEKLAAELIDAANDRGEAARKREEVHRMADANKAYSHYRW
jgi:small subunit ribosomal protein S7